MLCDFTYMCNLKTKQETYKYRELGVARREGVQGWAEEVKGIQGYKLPAIK